MPRSNCETVLGHWCPITVSECGNDAPSNGRSAGEIFVLTIREREIKWIEIRCHLPLFSRENQYQQLIQISNDEHHLYIGRGNWFCRRPNLPEPKIWRDSRNQSMLTFRLLFSKVPVNAMKETVFWEIFIRRTILFPNWFHIIWCGSSTLYHCCVIYFTRTHVFQWLLPEKSGAPSDDSMSNVVTKSIVSENVETNCKTGSNRSSAG